MAATDLIRVQLGQETAWGTTAIATAKLMGVTDANLDIVDETHQSVNMGNLYPSDVVAKVSQHGEGSVTMDLSYEDILYPLDNLFEEEIPEGVADPYTWTYTAPTDTVLVGNNYTMEFGVVTSADYEATGCTFTGATISGEAGGIWTGEFPFFSQGVAAAALTSLSDRPVLLIRMSNTVLSIDAWDGVMGATAAPSTLISFSLSLDTGRHPKFFAGGIAPASFGSGKYTATLQTIVEYNAMTKAMVDDLCAPNNVQRQIRIRAENAARSARIDFAGTLMGGVSLFDDRDGNITATLNWAGTYNDTNTGWLEFTLKNPVASLT